MTSNLTSTTQLRCSCRAVQEPDTLISSTTFPVETDLCHCTICRRTVGGLGGTFAQLTGPPSEQSLAACTKHTQSGGKADRYFCSTCGSRVFDYVIGTKTWYALSGIIDIEKEVDGDVVKIMQHGYVGDTGDGGLVRYLRRLGNRNIDCYEAGFHSGESAMTEEEVDRYVQKREMPIARPEDRLPVSCYCGAVQFEILRPDPSRNNFDHHRQHLRGTDAKYVGLFCVCPDCRHSVGCFLTCWTYVPPENVVMRDGKLIFDYKSQDARVLNINDPDIMRKALPSLKSFISTPDEVRRSFCSKCGASVFYEHSWRGQVVNVAAGLLRSESGALAEDWVVWNPTEVSYWKGAMDKEVVDAIMRKQ